MKNADVDPVAVLQVTRNQRNAALDNAANFMARIEDLERQVDSLLKERDELKQKLEAPPTPKDPSKES